MFYNPQNVYDRRGQIESLDGIHLFRNVVLIHCFSCINLLPVLLFSHTCATFFKVQRDTVQRGILCPSTPGSYSYRTTRLVQSSDESFTLRRPRICVCVREKGR